MTERQCYQKDKLTREDRQRAMRYLMFIKEERYGTVKPMLYVQLKCTVFGTLQAALLFWNYYHCKFGT